MVNNIDLEVEDPIGTVYLGNDFDTNAGVSTTGGGADALNNVEQVHINAPMTGTWTVRVVGTAVNTGTQGYGLAVTGEVTSIHPADLNGDGTVDGLDLGLMLSNWGNPGSTDLNNDGETDALDLVDFLVVYGAGQEGIQDFVAIVVNGIQNVMPCTTPTISVETLIDSICPECCSDSGCMYPSALNYDSTASVDAGSCVFAGCTDPTANNYKPNANIDDGSCSMGVCPDFDENGVVNLLDLLIFLLGFGS